MPTLKDQIPEGTIAVNDATGQEMHFYNGRWNTEPKRPKNPPAAIATLEGEDLSAIQGAQGINKDLDSYKKLMDEGRLVLGPVANTMGHIGNWLGMSNESSRNLASFESALQRLRNASLRLNKGVQTEGDAQRAWDELINSLNDVNVVKQRLDEIEAYNGRASDQRRTQVDMRREMYGIDPVDWGKVLPQPSTVGLAQRQGPQQRQIPQSPPARPQQGASSLTPAEQQELEALRNRFGGRR